MIIPAVRRHRLTLAIPGAARLRRTGLVFALVALACGTLAGCSPQHKWTSDDITGSFPALAFTMTRADDGKAVTAQDYRGKVVLLYFGYTFCPDVCPTTLLNVSDVLHRLGAKADDVRVLFVTVDPNRDTPDVLKQYVDLYAPQVDGLRGTPDALAALAKRYRVAYSVTPASGDQPYEVSHSSAVYVFDASGAARLVVTTLNTDPDIDGVAADLKQLIDGAHPGLIQRILSWL